MSSSHTLFLNGLSVTDNKLTGLNDPFNTTDAANKQYVDARVAAVAASAVQAVSNLVDSAPTALDTLRELASALGDDPNFATTTATSIGNNTSAITAEVSRATAAEVAAISTAAADATSKANAAQAAAVSTAAADATSKANAAQAAAISTASADATTKANAAQAAAIAAALTSLSAVETSTNENHSALVAHVQAIWDYFFTHGVDGKPIQPERYVDHSA